MNSRRVAALLRELADAIEAPEPEQERPRVQRERPKPTVEVDEVARQSARRYLRRAGVVTR